MDSFSANALLSGFGKPMPIPEHGNRCASSGST